ncbi:efflux RND transporter periplasmic adaptor subunit [Shimia sp. FJ5]|uniref:efflux RND transporter periplasmic adaptor subunit n=1 Tax=Shimia sp. FJ5 TaxID=3079054 RepID=UPI002633D6B8|nr:efflux RND transporter periplasmic adaptor subunit [Shimia sp. FJ5]MDV4146292.1 efflux RND transporter periplasmic adaptor subunit [Shimia sp. FJ5]
MSIWKQVLILAVCAALGYGGYEGYQRFIAAETASEAQTAPRRSGAAPVELAEVRLETLSDAVEAVGTTRARQSVDIVPEASGRIEEITFSSGQKVKAGAVLVRLDDTIARADLAEARAQVTERDRMLERMTQLRGASAVAEATLEDATARQAEAHAEFDRAEQRLAQRSLRAPFDGTIGLAEVDEGARVNAGTFIARLDDLSHVEVEFALPETLFARVSRGQTIVATSAAFPGQRFDGAIDAVDSRIDPQSRSFRARAVIPNPSGTLPSGMFMSLELTLSQTDHLVVPEEAILFQAAETYVFAVHDGIAKRTTVKAGQRRNGLVAILSGLEAGDRVVVKGLHRVRDGSPVREVGAEGQTPDGAEGES